MKAKKAELKAQESEHASESPSLSRENNSSDNSK